jgi:hypothetical protein
MTADNRHYVESVTADETEDWFCRGFNTGGTSPDWCTRPGMYRVDGFGAACGQHLRQVVAMALRTSDTIVVRERPNTAPREYRPLNPRQVAMADLAAQGWTLQRIAATYGVSRQRVSQILRSAGVDLVAAKQARQAQTNTQRDLAKVLKRMANATVCPVCGGWNLRGEKLRMCSPECSAAWVSVRYRFGEMPATHRIANARTILRNPAKYGEQRCRWATEVLSGAPPTRTFRLPSTKADRLRVSLGLVEPAAGPVSRNLPYRCAGTNRDGSACARTVRSDGDVCHIHDQSHPIHDAARQAHRDP